MFGMFSPSRSPRHTVEEQRSDDARRDMNTQAHTQGNEQKISEQKKCNGEREVGQEEKEEEKEEEEEGLDIGRR